MRIPQKLSKLLGSDKLLEAAVYGSIEELEPWITAGGQRPTFFPDYTDHSIVHIEEVLSTAVDLIRNDAWRALTAPDAAVLIVATILHDAAMHLSREGFENLLTRNPASAVLQELDQQSWSEIWSDFLSEAKRFDKRKLTDLFGDSDPAPIPDVTNLCLDDRTRRLIGEFIRRHHPRLAHEIAVFGVPGPEVARLSLRLSSELADLAGLIARSHGHSLRTFLPYLKKTYHNRVAPHGVHVVFLMALVRVADYLQIQATRAPKALTLVHRIKSPFSATEWNVHASIRDIRESEDDPETMFIRAFPADVSTYLRLQQWLTGLQEELDHSWAVLGEIYGRQPASVRRLGLKLRRIASNIDELAAFAASLSYVPKHVTFSTVGPTLLNLLIGPLYGERPEIGIRELLQNAIDAVRERQNLEARGIAVSADESRPGSVEIVIEESENVWTLKISDSGTGMTTEMITDYFLRAGASFRESEFWRQTFLDNSERSLILRSGRFGIGALAAFLVGEEVEVSTRHFTSPADRSICFSARIDTDPIELRWCNREIGTTISIRLTEVVRKQLFDVDEKGAPLEHRTNKWDWYCLAQPQVVRKVPNALLRQRYTMPSAGDSLPFAWHRIAVPRFEDVMWTFRSAPALVVNGIVVHHRLSPFGSGSTDQTFLNRSSDVFLPMLNPLPIRAPSLSVFDPDGLLPLDLRRESLTVLPEPLTTMLLFDVYEDFFRAALKSRPESPWFESGDAEWIFGLSYSGACSPIMRARPIWCWTQQGYALFDSETLWNQDAKRIVYYPVEVDGTSAKAIRAQPAPSYKDAVVVLVPFTRNRDHDDYGVLSGFGEASYLQAYTELVRRALWSLDQPFSYRSLHLQNVLSDTYAVYGIRLYSHPAAGDELDEMISSVEGNLPEGLSITTASHTGAYLIEVSDQAQLPSPVFSFIPGERVFPILEMFVERADESPAISDISKVWRKVTEDHTHGRKQRPQTQK